MQGCTWSGSQIDINLTLCKSYWTSCHKSCVYFRGVDCLIPYTYQLITGVMVKRDAVACVLGVMCRSYRSVLDLPSCGRAWLTACLLHRPVHVVHYDVDRGVRRCTFNHVGPVLINLWMHSARCTDMKLLYAIKGWGTGKEGYRMLQETAWWRSS